MNLRPCILLFLLGVVAALGQTAPPNKTSVLPNQPEALVRSLYQQVVARRPHDIPTGENAKVFAPYLSKALLQKIDDATACSIDWDRQNAEPHLKTKIASSYGLFSGEGAEANPHSFHIEKTRSESDGSLRVYVTLTWKKPSERPWNWHVAAVVVSEDGRYVIDDVIYINDSIYDNPASKPADRRLSEYLSAGCEGPRWIGYSLPNKPDQFAQSLYQQVVTRRPVGIPWGADWKALAPYLSKTLLHRIDLAVACGEDWDRQDQKRMMMKGEVIEKPPLAWLELGLFSGGDEESELRAFQIERRASEKDDSFRVLVRLNWGWPPEETWNSHVELILVREGGRLVVNNVIYLKDNALDADYQLSKALSAGCNGPHWVGYGDRQNGPKPNQK